MPLWKNRVKEWTDESPSVLESPMERGLRSAAKTLGLGEMDPGDVVNPITTGPVAPLVSIFKNKAAREEATKRFIDEAYKLNPKVGEAAEWVASKYPRVAAHTKVQPEPVTGTFGAQIYTGWPGRMPIEFTHAGLSMKPDHVRGSLMHEVTHGAQKKADPKYFNRLYDKVDEAFGYIRNPYEVGARLRQHQAEAMAGGKPFLGTTPRIPDEAWKARDALNALKEPRVRIIDQSPGLNITVNTGGKRKRLEEEIDQMLRGASRRSRTTIADLENLVFWSPRNIIEDPSLTKDQIPKRIKAAEELEALLKKRAAGPRPRILKPKL